MKQAILLALAALVALSPLAASETPPRQGEDGANVRISLTLTDGKTEWLVRALVLDGQRVRTTTARPVPVTTEYGESSVSKSFKTSYEKVGVDVTLHVGIVGPGRVRISGEVELGSLQDREPTAADAAPAPRLTTFLHVFDVVLEDGVAAELAETPDPEHASLKLTAQADIQE